jgi:hypothetical protein
MAGLRVNLSSRVTFTEDDLLDALDMMLVYLGLRKEMVRPLPHRNLSYHSIRGAKKILLVTTKGRDHEFTYRFSPHENWQTLVQAVGINPHTLVVNDREEFTRCFGVIVGAVHAAKCGNAKKPNPKEQYIDFKNTHLSHLHYDALEEDHYDSNVALDYIKHHRTDRDVFRMQ